MTKRTGRFKCAVIKNSPTNLILKWSQHHTVEKANFCSVLCQTSSLTYLKPKLFIRLLLEISLFLKPREENSDWGKGCKAPRLCFWFTIQIQTSCSGRNGLAGAFHSVFCKVYFKERLETKRGSWAPEDWKTSQSVCRVWHSPVPLRRKLLVHFSSCNDSDAMFQVSHCTVNDIILKKCLWAGIHKWRKCLIRNNSYYSLQSGTWLQMV